MSRPLLAMLLIFTGVPCLPADGEEKEIPGWGTAVDPDGDCRFELKNSTLTITAPGPAHDLSAELPDEVLVSVAAINASTQPFQPNFDEFKLKREDEEALSSPSDIDVAADAEAEEDGAEPIALDDSAAHKAPSTKTIYATRQARSGMPFHRLRCLRLRLSGCCGRKPHCRGSR